MKWSVKSITCQRTYFTGKKRTSRLVAIGYGGAVRYIDGFNEQISKKKPLSRTSRTPTFFMTNMFPLQCWLVDRASKNDRNQTDKMFLFARVSFNGGLCHDYHS